MTTTTITAPAPSAALSPVKKAAQDLLHLRINHTRIQQVMGELKTLIYPGSQDSLMLVCGPTGAGKTTLARYLVESELENCRADMQADAGLIPAAYVEAPASGENDFSWRLFYQRILHQLEGETHLANYAFGIDEQTGRMVRPKRAVARTLAGLRSAVERDLRQRGTRFLVIDEAAHIIRQTRPNRLQIQLDTLKSLANECGVQIVLVGAYDLYRLVSLSGQLARRTHVLHFERYREDTDADVRAFRACVQKFETELPCLWGGQLMPHVHALHQSTLGCIGTLSATLTRAAKLAEAQGGWSLDALRRSLLTQAQRIKILEEILEGEADINPGLTRVMPKPARAGSKSAASSHAQRARVA